MNVVFIQIKLQDPPRWSSIQDSAYFAKIVKGRAYDKNAMWDSPDRENYYTDFKLEFIL